MLGKSSQKTCPLTDPINTKKEAKCVLTFPKKFTQEDIGTDGRPSDLELSGC